MAKSSVEKRKPNGVTDLVALAITTCGVGYLPLAPGTWGSLLAVGAYVILTSIFSQYRYAAVTASSEFMVAALHAVILLALLVYLLIGVWAADRSIEMLGNTDASEAVVDEVIGQFIVFLFIPFTSSWVLIGSGFFLFRLFDVWKPYPIDLLQDLPGGLGICADDMLAGVYAGVCLAIIHAVTLYV